MQRRHLPGFTLIELLVVIAIIGLLATIITGALSGARKSANDAKRIADLRTIQLALSLYYNDQGYYPRNIYANYDSSNGVSPVDGLRGPYLSVVPSDPSLGVCTTAGTEAGCYRYTVLTSSGSSNCNLTLAIPNKYHLGAIFETQSAQLSTDADQNSSALTGQFSGYLRCTGTAIDGFNGNTLDCSTGADGTDGCYDLLPN